MMRGNLEQKVREMEEQLRLLQYAIRIESQAADKLEMDLKLTRTPPAGDSCSGTVTINVKCNSTNISGATVTISLSGTPLASGTTNGSGNFATTALTAAGTYDVSVSKSGFSSYTGTLTFACANQAVNVNITSTSNVVSGTVSGCGSNLSGALVTITQGVSTLGTASTNGSGAYSITLSGWSGGAITVTATKLRYANGSQGATPAACGGTTTVNITLSPATDYYCDPCGGAVPIYKTLFVTQPWDGAIVTLTYSGGTWSGTGSKAGTVYTDCTGTTTTTATYPVSWSFGAGCNLNWSWYACNSFPYTSPLAPAFVAGNPSFVSLGGANGTSFTTVASHTNSPFSATSSSGFIPGGGSGTATATE